MVTLILFLWWIIMSVGLIVLMNHYPDYEISEEEMNSRIKKPK